MFVGQKINGMKAKKLIEKKGGLLIDVRPPTSFRDGTLPGAINISLRQISSLLKHPKNTQLIFFADTNDDEDLRAALNYAVQLGFGNIYSLGAKDNWNK